MNITLLAVFIIAFILPIAYQRIHFAWRYDDFLKISLRKKVGLQIHHAHWGILWIFISGLWLVFGEKNLFIVALFAFGWGLLTDEIIPSLRMPSNDRHLELTVYGAATRPTLVLAGAAVVLVVIASILSTVF